MSQESAQQGQPKAAIVKLKPHSYQPSKAELMEDVSIPPPRRSSWLIA